MKSLKNTNSYSWLYGLHAVESALKYHSYAVKELKIAENQKQLINLFKDKYKFPVSTVESNFFKDFPKGNQKIAALVDLNFKQVSIEDLISEHYDDLCLVAFDGITDPQNLGSCIRSAKALNATGIIIQKHNNCSITPLVHKISAGAASCLPIYIVNNLHQSILKLKKLGVWIFGTSEHAEHLLTTYKDKKPSLIVFGSEGKGIRPVILKELDYLFSIPTNDAFQSLNISMACSICLYHFQKICN